MKIRTAFTNAQLKQFKIQLQL